MMLQKQKEALAPPIAFSPYVPISIADQLAAMTSGDTLELRARRLLCGKKPTPLRISPKWTSSEDLIPLILSDLAGRSEAARTREVWRAIGNDETPIWKVHDTLLALMRDGTITGRMVKSSSGPTWVFRAKASLP